MPTDQTADQLGRERLCAATRYLLNALLLLHSLLWHATALSKPLLLPHASWIYNGQRPKLTTTLFTSQITTLRANIKHPILAICSVLSR